MQENKMTFGRGRASSSANFLCGFILPGTYAPAKIPSKRLSVCAVNRPSVKPPAELGKLPQEPHVSTKSPIAPSVATKPAPARPHLSGTQIISERCADNLTEAYLEFADRLKFHRNSNIAKTEKKHVVVLGSGWGAHSLVKEIAMSQVEAITVISPRNYFFFTPLLTSTAVGTTDARSIVEPIRHANPRVEFFEAYATDVDIEHQFVHCRSQEVDRGLSPHCEGFDVPYDVLVVAVGETTSTFGVPGVREHAYFLKEISDAQRLRRSLMDILENAALPIWTEEERRRMLHFVIVGGGPTGCEFAGELADFVAEDLPAEFEKDILSQLRITLIQSGPALLTQFDESLQKLAVENFKDRVNIEFNSRVVKVYDTSLDLADGRSMDYGLLIWAAGNATRPIIAKLIEKITGEPTEHVVMKHKKIVVDPWLRVKGAKNIFALGDCSTVDGEPLPANAQVAGQQGAFIGHLISKTLDMNSDDAPVLKYAEHKEMSPFHFLNSGAMAYLGNDRAVIQFDSPGERHMYIWGRIAFVLWRSVYAVKQFDMRNSMLVLFDWMKTRIFGRDVSQI